MNETTQPSPDGPRGATGLNESKSEAPGGPSASGGGAVTVGFGPPAASAESSRRHRRVRPQVIRRRPTAGDDGWPGDPPPWAAVTDKVGHRDHPFG